MKNKILISALALAAMIACEDPYQGKTFKVNDVNPVSSYLDSRSDDFSEWIAVLKYADLYNALNQATQAFTAFVPNNEAVRKFYTGKGVSSIEQLGKEYAFELVRYHVIADSVPLEKFIVGGKIDKKTISQDYLTVTFDENSQEGGFNAIYINKEARVKELAVPVSNGYVYVLEGVLSPVLESAYEKLTLKGGYNIFLQALDATSWGDSIKIIYDEIRHPNGSITKNKRDYTVFGVSDDAFRASGINSLQELKDSVKVTSSDFTDIENELNLYVAYHILKGNYAISNLTKFDSGNNKQWGTLAEASVMEISLQADGKYYINYQDTVRITRPELYTTDDISDIAAKNGVIHSISAYAPIWEPDPTTVLFDFCDYPEIASYVKEHGTEGQTYQAEGAAEYRTALTNVSCYTVEISPEGTKTPLTTYNYVDYFTAQTGKNDFSKANNKDQLILNVGYLGSISMRTPILIKGRYKVTLHLVYATSMDFMRTMGSGSNGGKMKFSFDDTQVLEAAPYSASNPDGTKVVPANTLGCYSYELYSELVFDKTASHTLKIVVMDPAASSNSSFRIQLDYLLFEPITE